MQDSSKDRNEILQVSNKQIIAASITVIFSLAGVIGFLAYIIVNHFVSAIGINGDTIDLHTLEIAALHARAQDCQQHLEALVLVTNDHINDDDERMDRNEKNIRSLEERHLSNKDLINECRRAIWIR